MTRYSFKVTRYTFKVRTHSFKVTRYTFKVTRYAFKVSIGLRIREQRFPFPLMSFVALRVSIQHGGNTGFTMFVTCDQALFSVRTLRCSGNSPDAGYTIKSTVFFQASKCGFKISFTNSFTMLQSLVHSTF